MKKTYVTPEMTIQLLEERDIITSSSLPNALPNARKGLFSVGGKKGTSLDSDWDNDRTPS